MRNRVFKAMCKVPMNLQLFAEGGDGAGAGEGNGGGSGEGTGGEGDNPPSFDDFLKTGSNQAEFDRRVQKAVNTAVTNAQEKWQALTDDKLSEAEKLAKMTKEEKAQYMQNKKEKELSDREAAVTRSELMAEAKNNLSDEGLAQYSGETNRSLSLLMSSLTQLKNSLATAFAPILNVVAPILNSFIQTVINVVNSIGQLMGALTGKTTMVTAKKVNQDYAASLNSTSTGLKNNAKNADTASKAAKQYQRTLLGFDQINKLNDDSDSSGSGGTGSGTLLTLCP